LPAEIGQMTSLQELELVGNQLTELPVEILQLAYLKKLRLDDNKFASIPIEIGNLSHLHIFSADFNPLTDLPSTIGQLNQLTEFSASNNLLTALPKEIGELIHLKELRLYNNKLTELPNEICNLTNLQQLDLGANCLKALPDNFGNLSLLEKLKIYRNKLKELPPSIGSLLFLEDLEICDNALTALPKEIGQLTNLKKILVSNNLLTTLPPEIGQLTQLQRLMLMKNRLINLPPEIGKLVHLEELWLDHNQLLTITPGIKRLTGLRELWLNHNPLTTIPAEIGQLANLKSLQLYHCHLETLPPEIGQLSNLQLLVLGRNRIASLPVEIGNLRNLRTLNIESNPLEELPASLGQTSLYRIDFQGTPIASNIVRAIITACRTKDAKDDVIVWFSFTNMPLDNQAFDALDTKQKNIIYDWLKRLALTRDYKFNQTKLAKAVCKILDTVMHHEEFKEVFAVQVEFNNESCQDHCAMGFNELYTFWKIYTLPENAPFEDKIDLLTRGAKTKALRTLLSQDMYDETESAEIYLYAEIALKARLNLLTAIEDMSYDYIGKKAWLNLDALEKQVNETHVSYLIEIPAFEKMIKHDALFQELWYPVKKDLEKESEILENTRPGPGVDELSEAYLNWSAAIGALLIKEKKQKVEIVKQWLELATKGTKKTIET
jgi:Leucine-rich repeat (LRR) protein